MLVLVSCFFVTYQQQYVLGFSARTGTRYPVYIVNTCVHLIRALLQSPFLVYCLIFCDLYSFLAFGSASMFIGIVIYRDILLGTINSVGYFLQW